MQHTQILSPWKFSPNAHGDTLADCPELRLRHKLNNGQPLTRDEKNAVTRWANDNTYFRYAVPVDGWAVPFGDILRTFIAKQYGQWAEYPAVDKTALRARLYGRVERIIEVPPTKTHD